MRTRYALAALGLFCAPALVQAQNLDTIEVPRPAEGDTLVIDSPTNPSTHNAPQLTVNSPASLQRTFFQGVDLEEAFAAPYFPPDFNTGNGALVIGASVYTLPALNSDDVFDLASPFFDGSVTPGANADGTVTDPETGVTYDGTITGNLVMSDPVNGCVDATPGSTFANADEIAGNIAFVARGACNFSIKSVAAFNAGATAVLIYIPLEGYEDNRGAINMSAGTFFEMLEDSTSINIPSAIIPFGIAAPILDELGFGETINVTLGPSPFNPFVDADGDGSIDEDNGALVRFTPVRNSLVVTGTPAFLGAPDGMTTAIEDVVLEQGVTTMKAYPNPTAGLARVALATALPEVVRVEVYNTLGQRVAVLHDGMVNGQVDLDLDGSQFASGLYLVRATGASFVETTRVTIAR